MRILVLNWRYVGHPSAGGAEALTHGILRLLAAEGHETVCFTAAHPGAPRESEIDGVRVVRRGRQWTVHAQAWRWLRNRRGEFDYIVDQINTIPFFTPLYVGSEQRRFVIYQLAREYWWRETRGLFRLLSPVGYALEPLYLRLYRGTPCITISQSTCTDLERLGFARATVKIMPLAIDADPIVDLAPKPEGVRLIVLGRLTPAKFVEEAVDAFARIQRELPSATLDVIGAGDDRYRFQLQREVERRGLLGVTFHGRVTLADRQALLERAHLHIFASHREGWGLTVSEAGAAGTPSVGYDAPGVRDSIADDRLLATIGDSVGLAECALRLLREPERYARARRDAWERARALSIERTKDAFVEALLCPRADAALHAPASEPVRDEA